MKLQSSLLSTTSSLTSSSGVDTGGSSSDGCPDSKPADIAPSDLNDLGKQLASVCERVGALSSTGELDENGLDHGGKVVHSFVDLWRDMLELRNSQVAYRATHHHVSPSFPFTLFT